MWRVSLLITTLFSQRGIRFDAPSLISRSTSIYARYLLFITAAAENQASHKRVATKVIRILTAVEVRVGY